MGPSVVEEVPEAAAKSCNTCQPQEEGKDLLHIPGLRQAMRHRLFAFLIQIPNVVVFALIIATGLWGSQVPGKNLSTVLTWVVWWPLIIFTFILAGRLWCLGCPLGAVGEWVHRGVLWGKAKTNWSLDRKWPVWLRNLWLPTFLLLLVTWADHQFVIVSSPLHTAYFVIFILTGALIVGLLFERRAFCRYVCPIGGMIGLYSMLAPVGLRAKNGAACRSHRGKDCFVGNEVGYGCPMFEFPQNMDRNNYCNYCGECVKTCPKNNIAIKPKPFVTDLIETKVRRWDEAGLAVVLVGITTFQSLVMIKPWEGWVENVAQFLGVGSSMAFALLFGLIAFVAPVALFGIAVVAARLLSRDRTVPARSLFVVSAYMFVPVGLAMHLAHNLVHLINEGLDILAVLSDPFGYGWNLFGTASYKALPLLPAWALQLSQIGLLVIGQSIASYAGYKLVRRLFGDRKQADMGMVPVLALAAVFTILNVWVLGLPMAHRH